jgi:Escherichia/Staphylococcus phage prohead protease
VQRLAVKAASTITEQGEFTAIAATYSLDRQNERIEPGAFAQTIAAWQDRGGQIPLHWNHSASPEHIIGTVDPASMREEPNVGLHVRGQLDLADSEVAREAWRSMKNNAIGLSFGYLVTDSHEEDGVRVLTGVDVYEVTLTPVPANADTRVLSMKSANSALGPEAAKWRDTLIKTLEASEPPSLDELAVRAKSLGLPPPTNAEQPVRIVSFEC